MVHLTDTLTTGVWHMIMRMLTYMLTGTLALALTGSGPGKGQPTAGVRATSGGQAPGGDRSKVGCVVPQI